MGAKWVDLDDYFGVDRRIRWALRLLGERRKQDHSGEQPSIAQMLRRARVKILSVRSEANRAKALAFIETATSVCAEMGRTQSADALRRAYRRLTTARLGDKTQLEHVDGLVARAMELST